MRSALACLAWAPLLRLEDEAASFVEIGEDESVGAVGFEALEGTVEDVRIEGIVGSSRGGVIKFQQIAELGEEHLIIRPLGGLDFGPAGNERFYVGFGHGKWLADAIRKGSRGNEVRRDHKRTADQRREWVNAIKTEYARV